MKERKETVRWEKEKIGNKRKNTTRRILILEEK